MNEETYSSQAIFMARGSLFHPSFLSLLHPPRVVCVEAPVLWRRANVSRGQAVVGGMQIGVLMLIPFPGRCF